MRCDLPVRGECYVQTPHGVQRKESPGLVEESGLASPHGPIAHAGWCCGKRLPDQFIGTDLVIVKGLPWKYSASGVLMKKIGPRRRIAAAADEAERQRKTIRLSWTTLRSEEKRRRQRRHLLSVKRERLAWRGAWVGYPRTLWRRTNASCENPTH